MSEPVFALEIRIEEKAPRVNVHVSSVAEEARLASWIESQPKLRELIEHASRIMREETGEE